MAKPLSTPRRRIRLTPKRRVLRKHPEAWIEYVATAGDWFVTKSKRRGWYFQKPIGLGTNATAAWADAARKL